MNESRLNPSEIEFKKLLAAAQKYLENKWRDSKIDISTISPEEFEKQVADALNVTSKNTVFESSIKLVTGHKFPDISVMNSYGVEVKSTKSKHWKTLGNSVLESTRIPEIDTIYIFFAQLLKNPQIRFRKYQECLSDVQITHSPRYSIDMDLPPKQSIFDKIGQDYDSVRLSDKPISLFIDYYRRILGKDTSAWWISNDYSEKAVPMQIQFWSDLSTDKKSELMGYLFFLFPEIFQAANTKKYKRAIIWLVKNHSVIKTSMRDEFSAGGKVNLNIEGMTISVPQVIKRFIKHCESFKKAVVESSYADVKEYLSPQNDFEDTYQKRMDLWFEAFANSVQGISDKSDLLCRYIENLLER